MSEPLTVEVGLAIAGTFEVAIAEDEVAALVRHALASEGKRGHWEVGVRTVDDREIRALHRHFMGLDTSTDIMTFPYTEEQDMAAVWPGNDSLPQGGDIVISVQTAARSAGDAEWSLEDELRFLVLHGVLHLTGWDDGEPGARDRMLARQRDLLASF